MEVIRAYLEIAYFIFGGPVLAGLALYGLKQIILAEKAMKINSEREAFKLAAEQVHYFLTDIIPSVDRLEEILKEKNIYYLSAENVVVSDHSVKIKKPPSSDDLDVLIKLAPQFLEVLNKLESFCFPFCVKIAHETMAYTSIGGSFLHSSRVVLPVLIVISKDGSFPSIRRMYSVWGRRMGKKNLLKQAELLRNRAEKMKPDHIVPLGLSDK